MARNGRRTDSSFCSYPQIMGVSLCIAARIPLAVLLCAGCVEFAQLAVIERQITAEHCRDHPD